MRDENEDNIDDERSLQRLLALYKVRPHVDSEAIPNEGEHGVLS